MNKKISEYKKKFELNGRIKDLEIDIKSNLLEDILISNGMISHSSSCINIGIELGIATFVYGVKTSDQRMAYKNAYGYDCVKNENEWLEFLSYAKVKKSEDIKRLYNEKIKNLLEVKSLLIREKVI